MLHVEIEDVIGLFDLLVRKKLLEQPSLVRMLEHSFENITEPVQVDRILLSPLPWVRRFLSRNGASHASALPLASFYCFLQSVREHSISRQPTGLWDTLLGDKGALSLPEHASIAVLPFNDLSAIHDQQYLADGIAEELITGLAKFPDMLMPGCSALPRAMNRSRAFSLALTRA